MQHSLRSPSLDAHVQAAWQTQMAAAVHTPGLLPELMRRRAELFPRFAAYYTQLQVLPRRVRRALQRQWRLPLAGVALVLALGQAPVQAATIAVSAGCTLVDAITAANTDTAVGGCPAGSGADTIVLPAGSTQTLTEVNNTAYGPTGLPVIRSVITIEGQASTIRRDSEAPAFRIVAVNSTGDLTLNETTVSGGRLSEDAEGVRRDGGGVANYGGTVTMTHSTISGNDAGDFGNGAGVFNNGTLTVANSTFSDNRTYEGRGTGVFNSGTLTVANSTFSDNDTGFNSKTVANTGTCTVTHSTISSNDGGVANSGTMNIINSTISGNFAENDGGGVLNYGTMTMTNCTISGNNAGYSGGGVFNFNIGTMTIINSTISHNAAGDAGGGVFNSGTLMLAHTLVSGNTAATGPEGANSGTVVADNHNLFGVNGTTGVEGFSPGPTDVVPGAGVQLTDILNPTLANNGGPTQTHALVPGSPAIDAGDNTVCPATDQRSFLRPVDGNDDHTAICDIGAFEFGARPLTCGGQIATIIGTLENDVLQGTEGPDVIHGRDGSDIIIGLGGEDLICGGSGADILIGGDGNDRLRGQGGGDFLFGQAGRDRLEGGAGIDFCDGGRGSRDTAGNCETLQGVP